MMCTEINEEPQYNMSILHPLLWVMTYTQRRGTLETSYTAKLLPQFFNFPLIRNRHLKSLMLMCIIYFIVYLYLVIMQKNMCLK